jgi:hypothetical protein
MTIEDQVLAGQAALGQLMRQFLAVNDFKHVQFMQMAHAVTGARWLHSSQISSLKTGGTRNLTCFPLLSVAAVNRRIYEINAGLAAVPPGSSRSDWEHRIPMLRSDGLPLDVGDLWRVYVGELEPPLFSAQDLPQIDDRLAANLSAKLHQLYMAHCKQADREPMAQLPVALSLFHGDSEEQRLLKGVLLGVLELSGDQAIGLAPELANFLGQLLGEPFSERQVLELALN